FEFAYPNLFTIVTYGSKKFRINLKEPSREVLLGTCASVIAKARRTFRHGGRDALVHRAAII
ncbi:hypothetical protein, partial [Mesorhizobium sp.]|uniref:hypothetical protein n=1 Tax=Mesorhizobium sp. TaxID=1871066 RepID=UPI0025802B8A